MQAAQQIDRRLIVRLGRLVQPQHLVGVAQGPVHLGQNLGLAGQFLVHVSAGGVEHLHDLDILAQLARRGTAEHRQRIAVPARHA